MGKKKIMELIGSAVQALPARGQRDEISQVA